MVHELEEILLGHLCLRWGFYESPECARARKVRKVRVPIRVRGPGTLSVLPLGDNLGQLREPRTKERVAFLVETSRAHFVYVVNDVLADLLPACQQVSGME